MAKRARVKKATYKKAVKKADKKPRKQFKVLDHDEPIVVDNGPVLIANGEAVVKLKGGGKRAERNFNVFKKLIVKKIKNGMTDTEVFTLAEDGKVTFHLFDPDKKKSDTIEVERFPFDNVGLESTLDLFEFQDAQKKKLKMKGNTKARLTFIFAVGTDTVHKIRLADDENKFLYDSVKATVCPFGADGDCA
jgi:hypothetical protein